MSEHCEHAWVGDSECAYCEIVRLRARVAELEREGEKFYILSLKHTHERDDYITLWRANDCGYTVYLPYAGKYTIREIEESPDYYNNGRTTVAVPCSEVDALGVEAALSYDYSGPVVPNKSEIWEKLFGKRVEVKPNV